MFDDISFIYKLFKLIFTFNKFKFNYNYILSHSKIKKK